METSGVRVLKKMKVHIYLIKNHRNILLFGHYKSGFRWVELDLFSHRFDLKDLILNKLFEHFRKDLLPFTWPNVPNVQIRERRLKKQAFIFRNEQNPVPYLSSRMSPIYY